MAFNKARVQVFQNYFGNFKVMGNVEGFQKCRSPYLKVNETKDKSKMNAPGTIFCMQKDKLKGKC